MTATVLAQLVLGFRAGPLYREWPTARRATVATAAFTDILAKTTTERRIHWLAVPVRLNASGTIDETAIAAIIAAELAKTGMVGTMDPYVINLQRDDDGIPLPPVEITYVTVGGKIVCQHNYLTTHVARDGSSTRQNWDIAEDPEETAHVVAQLAIEVPFP